MIRHAITKEPNVKQRRKSVNTFVQRKRKAFRSPLCTEISNWKSLLNDIHNQKSSQYFTTEIEKRLL